jgi:hypothetical protein
MAPISERGKSGDRGGEGLRQPPVVFIHGLWVLPSSWDLGRGATSSGCGRATATRARSLAADPDRAENRGVADVCIAVTDQIRSTVPGRPRQFSCSRFYDRECA